MGPKKTKNANQHERRHENASGLVGPGRRIVKQRSNGNLTVPVANGTPPVPTAPPQPRMTSDPLPSSPSSEPNGHANGKMGQAQRPNLDGRGRSSSETSLDGRDRQPETEGMPYELSIAASSRRPQPGGSSNSTFQSASDAIVTAANIIKVCPLADVIATLMILLSIPSPILNVIQFLYAILTFFPPTLAVTLSALPSLNDIFQGSGGTPSVATVAIADFVIFIIWALFPRVPAQNFVVDIAQIVMAASLGGASGKSGATYNSVLFSVVILFLTYAYRYQLMRQYGAGLASAALSKLGFQIPFISSIVSARPPAPPGPYGWVRSLLGLHILTQGLVKIIRRSLSSRDSPQALNLGKKSDPEAGSGASPLKPLALIADQAPDTTANVSTDGRSPGPSPATRDGKDKNAAGRKKRKQVTYVRSQQPFWAAIASTKVNILKEVGWNKLWKETMLQTQAEDAFHLGNAIYMPGKDRVFVSDIGSMEVSFNLTLFHAHKQGGERKSENHRQPSTRNDGSRPFYVRVNGADWSSMRAHSVESAASETAELWIGQLFGLTPLSNYHCEFVRTLNEEVIYAINLTTTAAPASEQATLASAPSHQSLRPSSPTTTLKNSIAAAEAKLNDLRNRSKRTRKEHRGVLNGIKREVDAFQSRLSASGGNDDRQRQKVLQLNQTIRQADEAYATAAAETEALGDIPPHMLERSSVQHSQWQEIRNQKSAFCMELDTLKRENDRRVSAVRTDLATAAQKKDRLQAKKVKQSEQLEGLEAVNAQYKSERAKRDLDLEAKRLARHKTLQDYMSAIQSYESSAAEFNSAAASYFQQIQQAESLYSQHIAQQPSIPSTPEGPLPGSSTRQLFGTFQFPPFAPQASPYGAIGTVPAGSDPGSIFRGRGRSSSMLSAVSGLTEALDYPPTYDESENGFTSGLGRWERQISEGSSSGSGSHSGGSQRDPMSPVVATKRLGSPLSTNAVGTDRKSTLSPIGTGKSVIG